jgi:thiamine pyrophosphate-dependent acetolactate synthase large subunit-like protein
MFVYETIGPTLRQLGVRHLFGLMGRANMRFLLHMSEQCGIEYISARHEIAAVNMADAYARATGGLGVCTITKGPAVTHCVTAVVEANRASTPLLLLSGDSATDNLGTGQYLDQVALFGGVDIAVHELRGADTVSADILAAASRAIGERRPVVVPVPLNLQSQRTAAVLAVAPADAPPPTADSADLAVAADIVERAARPLVLAGRGALGDGAAPALIALADHIGALLATTVPAVGLFAGDPFEVGLIGVHGTPTSFELLADADAVLAFGTSLNPFTTCGGHLFAAVRDIVRVDLDPASPVAAPVTLSLTGDTARVAADLLHVLTDRGRHEGYRNALVAGRLRTAGRPGGVDSPGAAFADARAILAELDKWLPEKRTVVTEPSHGCGYVLEYLRFPHDRSLIAMIDYQAIGLGLGAAVGAAIAHRDRITIAAVGDGGAMMALGELETMKRYRLPVLVLVMNDSAYGAEVRELEILGLPIDPALFPDVDFAAVAGSFGLPSAVVRSTADLTPVRDWIADPDGPFVVDCRLDPAIAADWCRAAIVNQDAYLRRPRPEYRMASIRRAGNRATLTGAVPR